MDTYEETTDEPAWLNDGELDDPDNLEHAAGEVQRGDLLRMLAAQVVRSSHSPVSESALRERMVNVLDAAKADYRHREIRQAATDLESDGASIGRDRSRRYFYADSSGVAALRVFAGLRAASDLAAQIEQLGPMATLSQGFAQSMFREPLLSAATERYLAWEVQRGNLQAKERLVCANTRMVMGIARTYGWAVGPAIDIDDFFQDGCIGLIRAAEKFDPAMGNRFTTYATWWIRQSIVRGIADKGRAVRLPVHVVERVNKVRRVLRDLERAGQPHEPDPATLAHVSNVTGLTVKEIGELQRDSQPIEDLDHYLDLRDETVDLLGGAADDERQRLLRQALSHLPERERRVIELRAGLTDDRPRTLQEVGDMFHVTRERIRQIESEARKKLAQLPQAQSLRGSPGGGERLRLSPEAIEQLDPHELIG